MAEPAGGSTRGGRYITQPTGYRAFIPAPLPPDPPVDLAGELQGLLSAADRALGRLDGSVLTLPNPDLFVFMYVRKEAVLSSQIEGTQSSLQDLLAAEAALFDENLPRDVDEVINYVRAMNHGLARRGSGSRGRAHGVLLCAACAGARGRLDLQVRRRAQAALSGQPLGAPKRDSSA